MGEGYLLGEVFLYLCLTWYFWQKMGMREECIIMRGGSERDFVVSSSFF